VQIEEAFGVVTADDVAAHLSMSATAPAVAIIKTFDAPFVALGARHTLPPAGCAQAADACHVAAQRAHSR
jgi:hypothetical protein